MADTSTIIKSLGDDRLVRFPPDFYGWGRVIVGDSEFAIFRVDSAGTVTLVTATTGLINADTDGYFCIFYDSPYVVFKNRLGVEKSVFAILVETEEDKALLDGHSVSLADDSPSFGTIMVGDDEEFATYVKEADGTITLISWTAGVTNADTAGKWNIWQDGIIAFFKNQLGSTKTYDFNELVGTQVVLADDDTITLTPSEHGWGFVMAANDAGEPLAFVDYRFAEDGSLNLINATANVATADTDGFLCVYTSGTSIVLKNRLGVDRSINYYFFRPTHFGKTRLAVHDLGFADQAQRIEDNQQNMLYKQGLVEDSEGRMAEGAQLDVVGEHVKLKRLVDESDADYIQALNTKIKANASNGTGDAILESVTELFPDSTVTLEELGDAIIRIRISDDDISYVLTHPRRHVLRHIDSICIGMHIEVVLTTNPFAFYNRGAGGWGDTSGNYTGGGQWGGVIEIS